MSDAQAPATPRTHTGVPPNKASLNLRNLIIKVYWKFNWEISELSIIRLQHSQLVRILLDLGSESLYSQLNLRFESIFYERLFLLWRMVIHEENKPHYHPAIKLARRRQVLRFERILGPRVDKLHVEKERNWRSGTSIWWSPDENKAGGTLTEARFGKTPNENPFSNNRSFSKHNPFYHLWNLWTCLVLDQCRFPLLVMTIFNIF